MDGLSIGLFHGRYREHRDRAAAGSCVARVRLEEVFRGITPFFLMDVLTLLILVMFPSLSLWLPDQMLG